MNFRAATLDRGRILVAFLPMGLVPPLVPRRRIAPRSVALLSLALSLMSAVPQFLTTAGGLLGPAIAVRVRGRGRAHAPP